MKNTKIAAIVLLLAANILLGAADAAPTNEWEKTFTEGREILSVNQTSNGGYIIAGATQSFDGLLLRTDSLGNKQWSKTFFNRDISTATSVEQTPDGGYIMAGYSIPEFSGNNKGWVIKTNGSGGKQWEKIFTESGDSELFSISRTKDGGYITAGYTGTYPNYDMWLIKVYSSGSKQWSKKFGGSGTDFAKDVAQTKDGGYIIGGGVNFKATLVKTDSSGVQQWIKSFSDTDMSSIRSVQQTTDGGYIAVGDENSYYAHIIKTDSAGNQIWHKKYREGSGSCGLLKNSANVIQQTKDGGYVIGGSIEYNEPACVDKKGLLLKVDSAGNKKWSMELGGDIKSVQQTKDEGYIVGGQSDSAYQYAWLEKLTKETPVNRLKNPGFETIMNTLPQYWSKYQTGTRAIFTYPEAGRIGGRSVAIQYTSRENGKVALWRQSGITVNPSKQYKLSGYMKLSGVTGGGSLPRYNGAGLRVSWYRSDGSIIRTDAINRVGTITWTKYEGTFASPWNAVRATVGGDLFNSSGKVWFDDLSFVELS